MDVSTERNNVEIVAKKKIIVWIVIVLLMAMSFALGYLLRGENTKAPIIIEQNSAENSPL